MGVFLGKAMAAAGFQEVPEWFPQGRYYTVPDTGIDVALELGRNGEVWSLREVYDVSDLAEGGFKPVNETVSRVPVGQEMAMAKEAAMRAVERRVDKAIDEAA